MIILFGKITPALGLIEFAQIGTGKRPRTLEIRQVVILFREGLHVGRHQGPRTRVRWDSGWRRRPQPKISDFGMSAL